MAHKPAILTSTGEQHRPVLPKVKAVHPHGSKLLVEVLKADEILGTGLVLTDKTELNGAPQAYIIEVGPAVPPESGLKAGLRVYWTGKGTQIEDPNTTNGRVRALLEISNILAIIEEDK
jgi:co-chaperonin GroES (HSP10)